MKRTGMMISAAVLALLAGSGVATAQFGSDPFALPAVGDLGGDQTQSKTRMLPDGSFYVSWYDNRSGGNDVYLQRYNAAGVEQWAHNGILIADRSVSSTEDYDMRVDGAGNAVLAFGQDTTVVKLVKVDASGTIVFDTSVASGGVTGSRHTPRMCVLSDGNYMVGWTDVPANPAAVKLQKVNASGQLTGGVTTLIETTPVIKPYSLCELQPGENGSVIALWQRAYSTSGNSSKYLHAQKFDAGMAPQWPDVSATVLGVAIYDPAPGSAYPMTDGTGGNVYSAFGGSISPGAFPVTFEPDGAGGAVFSFYENAGLRYAFVQQVSATGVKRWNTDYGMAVTGPDAGFSKLSSSMAYNPASGDIFVSFVRSNTLQSQFGIGVQKIDAAGTLAWGALGVTVSALDTQQESFLQTVKGPDGGCYLIGFEAQSATGTVVQASRLGADGTILSNPVQQEVCSELVAKGRLWSAATPTGSAVFTFSNGSTGSSNLLLGNIRPDGSQGVCAADVGRQGGVVGPDGVLDNNDFISFIDLFFAHDPLADLGVQGGLPGTDSEWDNNDFVIFIDKFFAGCL